MAHGALFDEWLEVCSFLPSNWLDLAHETGALKGLRKAKSAESLLRMILLHCACGFSLRETVARSSVAGLAQMSDVALLKRLRKSLPWLQQLCLELLRERVGLAGTSEGLRLRLFDATHVQEPGRTGRNWRLHYSLSLPEVECDYFNVTLSKGAGSGESFCHFPIAAGDFIVADRGYCRGPGLAYVAECQAYVAVRLHGTALVLTDTNGQAFDLEAQLKTLTKAGQTGQWSVVAKIEGSPDLAGRLCVVRKTAQATLASERKSKEKARRNKRKITDRSLFLAQYVVVFTTFPEQYKAADILEIYRLRWQVEIIFKRLKQLSRLGHLPKYDQRSSKAWLYAQLLAALLTEKLIAHAGAISPWRAERCELATLDEEPVEAIRFYASPVDEHYHTKDEIIDCLFRLD